MRKIFINSIIVMFFTFFSLSVSAQEEKKRDQTGEFSGMVQLGGVWLKSDSQLETGNNNSKTETLYETPDSYNIDSSFILFEANYVLPTGTGFYIKTPFESGYGLSTGIFKKTPIGLFDVSGFYGFDESVWENPYQVDSIRYETDIEITGCDVEIKKIVGSNLDLNYKFRHYDVDKDIIGELFDDLKRDGSSHEIGFKYGFELGAGNMIQPSFNYLLKDMDGKSQSFSGYSTGLSFIRMTPNYLISLTIEDSLKNYDKEHPIFNVQREDRDFGVTGLVTWFNPLDMKSFFLMTGIGYNQSNSNIQFFDSHSIFTLITIGYQFD